MGDMPRVNLEETVRRITLTDEIWEWLDLLGDVILVTKEEVVLHEDIRRDTPYKSVLVQATNKDLSTLDAIYVLLRFELIHQAAAHVRLLCEGLITLRYISRDPAARADLFLGYADIEVYERVSALLEFERSRAAPRHVRSLEAFRQEVTRAYQRATPRYSFPDRHGKQRPFGNWCNRNVADQAKECGDDLVRLYGVIYKQMSAYVHGSAWSLRRQLAYSRIHYRADVVLNDVATLVRATIVVWAEFVKFWDTELGWNLGGAAHGIAERLTQLDAQHFPGEGDTEDRGRKRRSRRQRRTHGPDRSVAPDTGSPQGRLAGEPAEGRLIPAAVYSSVDECIASLTEELPLLRAAETIASYLGNKQRVSAVGRLVSALQDTDNLREHLKSLARPDGSIQFDFTPEAWAMFQQYKKTGR